MNDSFQYGDIIFLGLVAVFVLFRLRAMLGRNTGIDPREVWKNAARDISQSAVTQFAERIAKKNSDEDIAALQLQENKSVADGLKSIKAVEPAFSTTDFLAGAKIAFEWVVESFSKGDKEKLRMVLSDDRFRHFSEDIEARARNGVRRETTLVSILAADITEASINGSLANITVQFTTEQMNVMRDKDNNVVDSGEPSVLEKAIDVWTFERDMSSRDPNWKITAT